jgi:L-amino acid N-acyltransferase YncA
MHLRAASPADCPAIEDIYRHHVLRGLASFEEAPPDVEELARRHADVVGRGLPYLVAEHAGELVGYG